MTRRREPTSPYNPLEHLRSASSPSAEPRPVPSAGQPPVAADPPPSGASTRARRMPCIRVGLRPDRKLAFERLCHELAGQLGTSLPPSQLLRVCCDLLVAHQDVFLTEAHALRSLHRPPNDDHAAMRRFEQELQTLLLRVLRVALCARGLSM